MIRSTKFVRTPTLGIDVDRRMIGLNGPNSVEDWAEVLMDARDKGWKDIMLLVPGKTGWSWPSWDDYLLNLPKSTRKLLKAYLPEWFDRVSIFTTLKSYDGTYAGQPDVPSSFSRLADTILQWQEIGVNHHYIRDWAASSTQIEGSLRLHRASGFTGGIVTGVEGPYLNGSSTDGYELAGPDTLPHLGNLRTHGGDSDGNGHSWLADNYVNVKNCPANKIFYITLDSLSMRELPVAQDLWNRGYIPVPFTSHGSPIPYGPDDITG